MDCGVLVLRSASGGPNFLGESGGVLEKSIVGFHKKLSG